MCSGTVPHFVPPLGRKLSQGVVVRGPPKSPVVARKINEMENKLIGTGACARNLKPDSLGCNYARRGELKTVRFRVISNWLSAVWTPSVEP